MTVAGLRPKACPARTLPGVDSMVRERDPRRLYWAARKPPGLRHVLSTGIHVGDTAAVGIIFGRPMATPHVLPTAPVLESWEKTDHAYQLRLRAYLDQVEVLIGAPVPVSSGHIASRNTYR